MYVYLCIYIHIYIYLHMMYYIYYICYIHNIYIYLYIQYIQGRANRGGVGVYQFLNRVAENTKLCNGRKTFIPTTNYDLPYLKQSFPLIQTL